MEKITEYLGIFSLLFIAFAIAPLFIEPTLMFVALKVRAFRKRFQLSTRNFSLLFLLFVVGFMIITSQIFLMSAYVNNPEGFFIKAFLLAYLILCLLLICWTPLMLYEPIYLTRLILGKMNSQKITAVLRKNKGIWDFLWIFFHGILPLGISPFVYWELSDQEIAELIGYMANLTPTEQKFKDRNFEFCIFNNKTTGLPFKVLGYKGILKSIPGDYYYKDVLDLEGWLIKSAKEHGWGFELKEIEKLRSKRIAKA